MRGSCLGNFLIVTSIILSSYGNFVQAQNGDCEIEGVSETDWLTEFILDIKDVDRGETFRKKTGNITNIKNVAYPSNELNGPNPYVNAKLENGELVITLLDTFNSYEELETSLKFTMNIDFTCQRQTRQLNVVHRVKDTNNNKPEFKPFDSFDYKIYTPTGAGIPLTNLYGDLIVRDIDLTTKSINFSIEENSYVYIEYDRVDSSKKNHFARLVTKKVIMGIDEPIVLKITAQDIDDTGDPPNTISTTVTLRSDPSTQLPVAPVFDNAFYTAVYYEEDVTFDTEIKVIRGYDDSVSFSLEGTGNEYFQVSNKENLVIVSLKESLPENLIQEKEFLLFSIEAKKEDTSGANAAIYVSFSKVSTTLLFDSSTYKGSYEPGNFTMEKIKLFGLTEDTRLTLTGESSQYFKPEVSSDETININLANPLPENILNEFNYISLELKATALNNASAVTSILIDLPEKESLRLLIFSESVYKGKYFHGNASLQIEPITLELGYENDVEFFLSGDFSEQFYLENSENVIRIYIVNGTLPNVGNYITLTITAQGENALDASAAIVIEVEKDPEILLEFEKPYYKGEYFYINKTLNSPDIKLVNGYREGLEYELSGDDASYFNVDKKDNVFKLILKNSLPDDLAQTNLLVSFSVFGENEKRALVVTTISLERPELTILKFDQNVYEGAYYYSNETLQLDTITLKQGYTEDVKFSISEEWEKYFEIENDKNNVRLKLKEKLPEENEKAFITITLTASIDDLTNTFSNIIISLISYDDITDVLIFESNIYNGFYIYENETLNAPQIKLNQGYDNNTEFKIKGESANYFDLKNTENVLEISLNDKLPDDLLDEVFIYLEIFAEKLNTPTASTILTITLIGKQIILAHFEHPYYEGIYYYENKTLNAPSIILEEGYTENTMFSATGEYKDYFLISNENNIVNINTIDDFPASIAESNLYVVVTIVAKNSDTLLTSTAITIGLIKETDPEIILEFGKILYEGDYNKNETLTLETIILEKGYSENTTFELLGANSEYFTMVSDKNQIKIDLKEPLPANILNSNAYLVLSLEAKSPNLNKASANIIISLENIDQVPTNETLRFEYPLYEGIYNDDNVLSIDKITLKEGYSELTEFTLSGKHSEYFALNNEKNIVEISLKSALPIEIISTNSYLTLILEADSTDAIGAVTIINIGLPSSNITDILLFESNVYSGFYLYENETLSVPLIKLNEGYDNYVEFKIKGEWASYFDLKNTENILEISLKEKLPDKLLSEVFIYLEILAEKPNSLTTSTILTITLIGKQQLLTHFEQPYYEGIYKNLSLEIEPIKILGSTENISFIFNGDYNEYFNAELRDDNVYITSENIPEDIINKEDYILLVLEVQTIVSRDYTTIFIKISKDQKIEIEFESSEYNADITTTTLGEILTVKAFSNPPATINYYLDINDDYLKSRIQIGSSTGIINISSYLNKNIYKFLVIAENLNNLNASDNSTVILTVRDTNNNDINLDPLIITSIIEHEKHDEIFDLGTSINKENCSYEISNSWPAVENWFYINNKTGYLASYEEIDRENPLISELSQLQLEFILSCDEETDYFKLTKQQLNHNSILDFVDDSERHLISASNIKYTPDKRYLTVLVEDINDNPPEFTGDNPLVVGYPSNDIVFTIRPPSLTTIQAIDKDIGENAKIKYITFDSFFTVHPESGVVYPRDSALLSLNTDHSLVIFAVDKNGIGLNASLSITIKPLNTKHLSVMKLKNVLIEDVSDILTTVSNELQFSIRALHSVVMPEETLASKDEVRSFMKIMKSGFAPKEGENSFLSIFIYGIDENLELLDASEVIEQIKNTQLNSSWNVEATELEDSVFLKTQIKHEDATGLIIAVSILSVLLFLAIVGFFIWFFLILPRSYRRMTESSITSSSASSSTSDDSEDSKENVDIENITRPVQHNNIINNQNLSTTLEGIITPSQKFTKEIRKSPPVQNKNYMDTFLTDENQLTEKQKPVVTFNETVQQIEVDEYEVERL